MAVEIATIVDDEGRSSALNEPGLVLVYRRFEGEWEIDREMEVSITRSGGLQEMRAKMSEILQFLGECRILVARAAGGALFYELEKAGFSVWEISGKPADFLDVVLEDDEKDKVAAKSQAPIVMPAPQEIGQGKFFISIREIQGKIPGITSKQILSRFVTGGKFDMLEILCDHVPPWIEIEAERRGFTIEAEKNGPNEVLVRLTASAA